MEVIMWNHRTEKFILDLDREVYLRVLKTIHLLIEQGNTIAMPDSKSLGKGLFELRIVGKSHVRLLYIFHKNKAYIIHGFIKKAWRINSRDIDYARKIQEKIIELA
ncbi:MAG: type II toxin-antitoxin system RelE/ParE family toxin [Patescibacteria group bacterium]